MATRDHSQGIEFKYPQLVKQNSEVKKPMDERIKQIKENLDRLQSLHHRLHSVLNELAETSKKKK